MSYDYRFITEQVIALSKEVANYINRESLNFSLDKVETKSKNDFVSYVDQESEKLLVEALRKIVPEAGFVTEEGTTAKANGEDYLWIIDPLDGTTNFIHGSTPYAISIALSYKNDILVGVIHEITRAETFYAWKGSKAYLNGREIQVSKAAVTADSLIATGFPYYDFSKLDNYLEAMNFFMRNSHGMRRLGSAATDIAYVAAGRFEGFYEHALHSWDVAAGLIILKQAGGRVCDFNGGDNYIFGGELIACNANYFDEFYAIVHKHLGIN